MKNIKDMFETTKKVMRHKVIKCFAALGMLFSCAGCVHVIEDSNGNAITAVDHTEQYIDGAIKLARVILVEAPVATAHLAGPAAEIVEAAGGIYHTKRAFDSIDKQTKVVNNNVNQYWNWQNNVIKQRRPVPERAF